MLHAMVSVAGIATPSLSLPATPLDLVFMRFEGVAQKKTSEGGQVRDSCNVAPFFGSMSNSYRPVSERGFDCIDLF